MALDISTEFETGEESVNTSDHIHSCILELRLVSSNIQNLDIWQKIQRFSPWRNGS